MLASLLFISGCSDPDPADMGPTPDLAEGGAAGAEVSCALDARVDAFAQDSSVTGSNGLSVTVDSGDPLPPARGDNTWVVTVLDAAGQPLEGALLEISARMPDHGHMSPSTPQATATNAEGRSTISGLNLFMAGVWVVDLHITEADAEEPADSVSFTFCVEG